jgi:hypothetical protein
MDEKNENPRVDWEVTVSVFSDWQWSKNRMWKTRPGGHARYLAPHARQRRDMLATLIRQELTSQKIHPWVGKLWLDIHVEIPNHRGDALNMLDLIADGVQDGTSIDDRWYWIRRMSWTKNPKNPRITVTCGQYVMEATKK